MATSSISSILNSKYRMTGLASGLDTDSMVQQLLKNDIAKVDKYFQKKTLLEWKRNDYRSMINVARDFRDTYFNVANASTNFRSASAFSSFTISSSDESIVTATAGAGALPKTHTMEITSIAKAANITGKTAIIGSVAASGAVSDFNLKGKQIAVTLDGVTKTIGLENYTGLADMETKLETAFKSAFGAVNGNSKIDVDVSSGKASFKLNASMGGSTFRIAEASNKFISTLGFANGKENTVTGSSDVDTGFSDGTFKITVGTGSAQTITVDSAADIDELVQKINNEITASGELNGKVFAGKDGNKLKLTSVSGESIVISSGSTNNMLSNIGLANGLTFSGTGGVADLTGDEQGKSFTISIDGVDKTITIDQDYASLDNLISYLNNPAAVFTNDGANSLSSMGVKVSKNAGGDKLIFLSDTVAVNSSTVKELSFSNGPEDSLIKLGFGASDNLSNGITLNSSLFDLKSSFATALDIDDTSKTDTVQFTINGTLIDLGKDYTEATINDVITAVNQSDAGVELKYDSLNVGFLMNTKSIGSDQKIELEEDGSKNLLTSMGLVGADVTYKAGEDAAFSLDGVDNMRRSTNSFVIDGVSYTLKKEPADPATPLQATIRVSADVGAMYTKIKAFVDKYNEVISKINAETSEKKSRTYLPLTDEQKSAMNESDITKWEEIARTGMLKGDSTLNNMTMRMRQAFYDGIYTDAGDTSTKLSYNLSSIGISTGLWEDKGKLIIDETKLKTAIANSPDKVMGIFTKESSVTYNQALDDPEKAQQRYKESGIAQRLYDIIQDNIRTTRNSNNKKGELIEMAGITGDASEFTNSIDKEIDDYETRIDKHYDMITQKENMYYTKFARLETMISQLNSQGSWISSQMGSSGG